MAETVRAFVAAELPVDVRHALDAALTPHRRLHPGLKWVAAHNLHLTVKFLGNVGADRVDEFVRAVGRACQLHPSFALSLRGWGTFPPRGQPRVLWVGIQDGREQFERLAKEVDRQLAKRGIAPETRPISAHLTVARWPRQTGAGTGGRGDVGLQAAALASPSDLPQQLWGPFDLSSLAFMRSDLWPGGPIYSRLAEIALGGTA